MSEQSVTASPLCSVADLTPGSGTAVIWNGEQIALFYLPDQEPCVYGVGNYDPLGGANVISRGIVGDRAGTLVVASPLYKQHFSLRDGRCLEEPDTVLPVYPVAIAGDQVVIHD